MATAHDIHAAHDLFLWFCDDGLEEAEVERCDDLDCEVCAGAEARPFGDLPDEAALPEAA